ncbi:MAG: NADH-quinone oxidoreductase subunit NuoE [Deltaproteobacteria bacterium]|nr:NADH-quinone oxidoreductase subunit NuoE [Deltaproteobacteria bacterium]
MPATSSERFARSLWTSHGGSGELIPLLQAAQDSYGYVPEEAMESISGITGIPVSEIYGVVTFYKQFRLTPVGRHIIKICNGTACHVNGSSMLESTIEDVLRIHRGETDGERLFTLESVNCIGCCSLAPVIMVDDETYGSLTPRKLTTLLKRLQREARAAVAGEVTHA